MMDTPENKQAKRVFEEQTLAANNQKEVSKSATKQMNDKIKDCVDIHDAANPFIAFSCVIGYVYSVEEVPNTDSSEPIMYYTHFSPEPNTFFLFSDYAPWSYVGNCVKVWGEITYTPDKIPAIYLSEFEENIEKLPDEICRP